MKTVAIIPARGGSKGVPRKNVLDFCGAPLLAWTIAAARAASGIQGTFVSTDSPEIAQIARAYGAEVVDRPREISDDRATSESALIHALDCIREFHGSDPERVVFLQATSPLREAFELDESLLQFERERLDSLFAAADPEDTLVWLEENGNFRSINYDYHNRGRRQDRVDTGRLWVESGSFYISKTELIRATNNRLGGKIGVYSTPFWKSFEIDSHEGFELCQTLMRHYGLNKTLPPLVG